MDVLLALLHLAAYVTLALGLALPAVRRIAILTLAITAIAGVVFGALEPGLRTLETVHTYTGFEGASLEAAMVEFPTGTVTAPGWHWPLPFAAFAVIWILWLLRLGDEPQRTGAVTALAFAWTATAAWLGMQALAAPSAVVQPFALDRHSGFELFARHAVFNQLLPLAIQAYDTLSIKMANDIDILVAPQDCARG